MLKDSGANTDARKLQTLSQNVVMWLHLHINKRKNIDELIVQASTGTTELPINNKQSHFLIWKKWAGSGACLA